MMAKWIEVAYEGYVTVFDVEQIERFSLLRNPTPPIRLSVRFRSGAEWKYEGDADDIRRVLEQVLQAMPDVQSQLPHRNSESLLRHVYLPAGEARPESQSTPEEWAKKNIG